MLQLELRSEPKEIEPDMTTEIKRLIHWSGTPTGVCERKDQKADQTTTETVPDDYLSKPRTEAVALEAGKVIWMAEADHYGNVTCQKCRKAHNAANRRKK